METVVLVSPYQHLATNALFKNREAFAPYGIDVEFIYTRAGGPVVQAMLDGRAGYTHVCAAPVPAAVAGRGLKILGAFQTSSFALFAHPEIKSLRQLAGKTINLTGSITRPALETALRRHGVTIDSVTIAGPGGGDRTQTGGGPEQIQSVLDGRIAAISVNAPYSVAALQAGLQCLLRFGDVYPIPTFALLVRDSILREQRDQVVNVMRGVLQSIDDFIRDRELGMNLLREVGVPAELLEGSYWEVRGYLRPDGRLPEAVQRLWIEWSKGELGLTEEIPLSRAFDFSVREEVLFQR